MRHHTLLFSLIPLILLIGCGPKAERTFYDKQIAHKPIACLSLMVSPPNSEMEATLHKLYHFQADCPYRMTLRYRDNIVCNSHYNAQAKALGKMPNSYINLELQRGFSLLYSYYIDLDHTPGATEVEEGFETLRSDLMLH